MKVTGYQLFWLISISSIIIFSYVPIKLAAEQSLQDSWISILLGGIIMLAITWLMLQVCMQNKDKTLVAFIKDLLGTVLGKIFVTFYFILWFIQMSTITRGLGEFQNLVLLHEMPVIVIFLCMLFLVVYVVFKGGITDITHLCGLGVAADSEGHFIFLQLYDRSFDYSHALLFCRKQTYGFERNSLGNDDCYAMGSLNHLGTFVYDRTKHHR
nr:GerAB/ArcD/ProY family transporter [Sutcliffiella halmapala]